MTSQEKLNLVTNYFAEDWAIEKAMQLLEDYDKAQQPTPSAARPVTPYTCPKCHALWLHWPAEQAGFGCDTLNCRSADHCHYCEKAGVEQLQRLERVPAVLSAPQPTPPAQPAVQQGDATRAAARALSDRVAEMCNVDKEDHWEWHSDDVLSDAELVVSTYLAARAPADSVLEDAVLLKEARDALWQPANVALCERIDAYLDAAPTPPAHGIKGVQHGTNT